MTRLKVLNPDQASGKTKELFNAINSKFGLIPNMMKTMGNSPALLEGFLNFNSALSGGTLGAKTSALIALAVSESNGCHYCLVSHTFVGANITKLDADAMKAARKGNAKDAKTAAILRFAQTLVSKSGRVSDEDVNTVRAAGATEGEVGEIVGHVALNILTNYFNNTANTELDAELTVALPAL
jgi:uncharacterized peroxidase-related enzyme